jgi:hypothetical protein
LADIEFTAFPAAEANDWLAGHGHAGTVTKPTALAALYGRVSGNPLDSPRVADVGFGFARALAAD